MTEIDLEAIEARANAATEGPWIIKKSVMAEAEIVGNDGEAVVQADGETGVASFELKDGEFIAHARTDIPALIAEVRRLRERLIEQENA